MMSSYTIVYFVWYWTVIAGGVLVCDYGHRLPNVDLTPLKIFPQEKMPLEEPPVERCNILKKEHLKTGINAYF